MSLKSSVLAFASQTVPAISSRVLDSAGYTLDTSRYHFDVWSKATAERQDRAWNRIVAEAKAGRPRRDVVALYEALDPIVTDDTTLLEVGCGGGYYSEIIAHRFPALKYRGLDISPASIALAKEHYPSTEFVVGSAYELPNGDSSIDIVMDGVAIVHMPDWKKALAEYARVARSHVVIHGVTVSDSSPTTQFAKYAYGQPSLELAYARSDLLDACLKLGLSEPRVIKGLDYDLEKTLGIKTSEETWVLRVG
jgi:SAM-dependent methyltransferase